MTFIINYFSILAHLLQFWVTDLGTDSQREWIDEDGNKVQIRRFFSKVYVDGTVNVLNKKFSWNNYAGKIVLNSLGEAERAEREEMARTILLVGKLNQGWCGVAVEDLFGLSISQSWYLDRLVASGHLRRKKVMGTIVVFPTEKLMENQKVPPGFWV